MRNKNHDEIDAIRYGMKAVTDLFTHTWYSYFGRSLTRTPQQNKNGRNKKETRRDQVRLKGRRCK
jgi:hypothetical protein